MEEEKKKRTYYSQSQNRRTQAYIRENYDQVSVRIPKGKKQLYQDVLKSQGLSMNEYLLQKLEELL